MKDYCCVVDSWECKAPANLEYSCISYIRTKCFACGLTVCKNCSEVVRYYNYGKRRICFTCMEEHDIERTSGSQT